ncbi:MAG: hypothetical protein ACKVP0_08250 [Pirellulaceae bacterium]
MRSAYLSLVVLLLPLAALGQQVATDPTSTHIFPAGGRRGATVDARIGGECLPPLTRIRAETNGVTFPEVLGPRAKPRGESSLRRRPGELHINYPKEWESKIAIAADAPLGPRLWWLSCARGGTGGRPFLVGELPEYIESESNSSPEKAEQLTLPVTLNGQTDGERDMDYFTFDANAGEVVAVDVVAARIGSPLNAVLEFHDQNGRRLPVQEIRVGSDPVIALRVPKAGKIRFSVANLSAAGGPHFVYRITLSKEPYARLAFPSGGRGGEARELELFTLTGEPKFAALKQTVQFPMAAGTFLWSLPGGHGNLQLESGLFPEMVEQEPNDKFGESNKLTLPAQINGRLEIAADEDWFGFEARQGMPLTIACQNAGAGLPTLPILSICDSAGKELAKASAIDVPDRLPRIDAWAPPTDGAYFLRVRDVQQGVAGGPEFVYRISVAPVQPDFDLALKTDFANHLPGGRTELDVTVLRRGGFSLPVKVAAQGLPEGVRAEPLEIAAGVPSGKLVLVSDKDKAPPSSALLKITGTADIAGQPLTRIAVAPHLGRDVEGVSVGRPTTDSFHLTVLHKPLFRLFCSEAYQYAHRGTIHQYQMEVERFDGYAGPIRLQIADRQNKDLDGVEILETTIPAGENKILLPLHLPETMHINVQAHSNVYAQGTAIFQDSQGKDQSTCIVSEMRCMIRTLPTVARLLAVDHEIVLAPDGQASCRLRLERTSLFSGPLTIELVPEASSQGITAEPVVLPAGEKEVTVKLRAPPGTKLLQPAAFHFRGRGDLGGGTTVVTEATVAVRCQ